MIRFNEKMTGHHQSAMKVMKALGDENRFRLVRMMTPGVSMSLIDIISSMPLSRTATVHHVKILQEAGILVSTQNGKETLVSIPKDNPLIAKVLSVLERP